MSRKPHITVITPVYNEEGNIHHFYAEITKVLRTLPYKFDIIFVDDGSQDKSAELVRQIQHNGVATQLIQFSRNFGKEIAVTAGLHNATGEAALVLDADLQHPVDVIPQFIEKWQQGADVVVGVRTSPGHKSRVKRLASRLFYQLINSMSSTYIKPHATDFRLLDRKVIDEFNRFTERGRITRGLIDWLGFDRDYVYFKTNERQFGTPSYSYRKLIGLAMSTFISHSLFPLRLAGYMGIFILMLSWLAGTFVVVQSLILGDPMGLAISGTAMLAIGLLFSVGVILACLGLMALYIATIHNEVTNRPLYVVRNREKV